MSSFGSRGTRSSNSSKDPGREKGKGTGIGYKLEESPKQVYETYTNKIPVGLKRKPSRYNGLLTGRGWYCIVIRIQTN